MKTFMKGLVKVLLIVLLLVITAAAVLYIEGYYDFTFIDRKRVMNVLPALISGEEETVSPYQDAYTAPRAPGDNLSQFTHPEAVGGGESDAETEAFELLDAAEAISNGWIITDTDYDRSTHIITERKQRLLYTISCKAAIKGGRRYGVEHIKWICDRLFVKNPGGSVIRTCPHGRPVAFEIKRSSIDRQFGRLE